MAKQVVLGVPVPAKKKRDYRAEYRARKAGPNTRDSRGEKMFVGGYIDRHVAMALEEHCSTKSVHKVTVLTAALRKELFK